MIAEQAARDLGGIGLAGLDLDFRSLERLAVLGGVSLPEPVFLRIDLAAWAICGGVFS